MAIDQEHKTGAVRGRGAKKTLGFFAAATILAVSPAAAQQSAEDIARLAQNPLAKVISLPFQNNVYLGTGPEEDKTANVLNIQPVIPIELNADWNIITRTVIPVISEPGYFPGQDRTNGVGDIQFSAVLSPVKSSGFIWGVGPVFQLPSHSNDRLGNDHWGLGPGLVVLSMEKGSPWVYGALINNVWSVGSGDDPTYNHLLLQPFVNYNFGQGVYLASSPIITADWKADNDNRWTVPLGGGVGYAFHVGRLPVNMQFQAFYNVVTPEDAGGDWTLRFQIQAFLPNLF